MIKETIAQIFNKYEDNNMFSDDQIGELKFIFRRTLAVARKRQITVRITPDGCTLKQRKEDKVIRGLLQKWGFAK